MKTRIRKIACLGDSFTAGYGVRPGQEWASLLKEEFHNYEFLNCGINGDTTSGMLARLRRHVIDESPSYAVVIGGVNDLISAGYPGSASQVMPLIKNNLMAMTHQLFDARIIPILACHPPCISEMVPEGWSGFHPFSDLNDELEELNRWIHAFAKTFYCSRMDVYTPMRKIIDEDPDRAKSLYVDGIHLTAEGHRNMAGLMRSQLCEILR